MLQGRKTRTEKTFGNLIAPSDFMPERYKNRILLHINERRNVLKRTKLESEPYYAVLVLVLYKYCAMH